MSVNVSYSGTVHTYGVSRGMLVQNLKEEISKKQGLHQFQLMLGQVELVDEKPVIKYLFTTFTLCYDDKEAVVEINDMNLGVAVVNPEVEKVITEKATLEMTVGELKESISRQLSSTQGKWTLKKEGKEIPDGDLLKTHLEAKTFTVITREIQVTIKYEGRNYSISTKKDMTVLEFKVLCYKRIGITVDSNLRIVFNGRELYNLDYVDDPRWVRWIKDLYCDKAASWIEEMRQKKKVVDNQTLESHGITHESTISIIYYQAAPF